MEENQFAPILHCACGKDHVPQTGAVVCRADAALTMADYIQRRGYLHPALFCDENTEKYAVAFPFIATDGRLVFAGNAHATEVEVSRAAAFIAAYMPDVLIACGSGSLHDITRYAAAEAGIPFLSYPTAASVDGFMSGVAAMTWYGQKRSFPAVPPEAVFADPVVCADAPERLTASGVGDVLGKYTSLFDWRFAHILNGEWICPSIVHLTENAVRAAVDALDNRRQLPPVVYTEQVLRALLLSGFAMQLAGNSRPASAAEHHLSHFWEMECINGPTKALHGEQVAVGTMLVWQQYHTALFSEEIPSAEIVKAFTAERLLDAARLEPVFGSHTAGIIQENLPHGTFAASGLSRISTDNWKEKWEAIRREFEKLPSSTQMTALCRRANCIVTLEEAHLPDTEDFRLCSLRYAPYVRERLTLLKLLSACEKI